MATKTISAFGAVTTPAGGDNILVQQTDGVTRKATWTQLDLFVRVPDADGTKDLGSASLRFRDLFLSRRITLSDVAGDPSAAGQVQRNGASLKFHDGTAARTLAVLNKAQTFSEDIAVEVEDARTNTVDVPSRIASKTTGTPAAGIGVGQKFQAESADEAPSDFGQLEFAASDVTAASEDTVFRVLLRVAGAALAAAYEWASTTAFKAIFTHANTADRTYTLPNFDGTLSTLAGTETLTNKTLTAPTLGGSTTVASAGTIVPAAVVGTPAAHGLFRENTPKGWAKIGVSAGTPSIADSFNTAGISDDGVGLYTITWDRDFAGTNYVLAQSLDAEGLTMSVAARAVGTTQVSVADETGAQTDSSGSLVVFGDQ